MNEEDAGNASPQMSSTVSAADDHALARRNILALHLPEHEVAGRGFDHFQAL